MKKRKIIILSVVSLLVVIIVFFLLNNNRIPLRLEDDFYEHVNYYELKKHDLSDDKQAWSYVDDIDTENREKADEIVKKLYKDNINVKKFYDVISDFDKRNELGVEPLVKYIKMVEDVNTIDEFLQLNADFYTKKLSSFILDIDTYADEKTAKFILYLGSDTYSDYDGSFIFEKNNLKNKYSDMFYEFGYSDEYIDELVSAYLLTNIEKDKNVVDNNEYITRNELKSIYTNIDLEKYLDELKYDKIDLFLTYSKEYHKNLNGLLVESNIDTLKKSLIYDLIVTNSKYLTMDLYVMDRKLLAESYNVTYVKEDLKECVLKDTRNTFYDIVGVKFIEKYQLDKEGYSLMINDIINAYKTRINNSDWLDQSTKEGAIRKLDNLKIVIGLPEDYYVISNDYNVRSYEEGSNYLENIININSVKYNYEADLYNSSQKVDPWKYDDLGTYEVNCFYSRFDNSINVFAGFTFLSGDETSYYKILGITGQVIGHEISHAFDINGSKTNEEGILFNWWTENDIEEYEKRTKKIVSYYNQYNVTFELGVNGKKTLSENIADLAGLDIAVELAKQRNATKKDYKDLFESFAKVYAENLTDQMAMQYAIYDVHSPNKVRVNAVLSSNDTFYDVYGIGEGDDMFKNKEDRVGLW